LGNDFIAMLKESSLLSAIGVAEITQKGGFYATTYFLPISRMVFWDSYI